MPYLKYIFPEDQFKNMNNFVDFIFYNRENFTLKKTNISDISKIINDNNKCLKIFF